MKNAQASGGVGKREAIKNLSPDVVTATTTAPDVVM
nr:hypothetical protein [Tanacetum cinerariifolium]